MSRGELWRVAAFRRLWLGDAISMFGDWFTYVAVGVLALSAEEGLWAVAFVLVAHTLPRALLAPLAGRLADRHDRRRLMVVGSLLRAATVGGMIAAALVGSQGWLAALLCARMGLSAFIEPAAAAALPRLVPPALVGPANAWLGATWSVVFGVGVALGGVVTAWLGPVAALAIDAATFVIAAGIFAGLPRLVPEGGAPRDRGRLREAWRLLLGERALLRAALAKTPVAAANGGAWVLLHAMAAQQQVGEAALVLGAMHAVRAAGTGVGPLLWGGLRRLAGSGAGLTVATWVTFAGVAAFVLAGPSWWGLAAVGAWGLGIGACWVTATTRIQMLTPNASLGRVAAIDLLGHTLGQCVGGVLGAWAAVASGVDAWAGWLGVGLGVGLWSVLAWAGGGRRGAAWLVSWWVVLVAACGPRGLEVVRPDVRARPEVARVEAREEVPREVAVLAARAVYHDDFARPVLYTWTTAAQAAALRASRRLLVADASTRPTAFNQALLAIVAGRGPGVEVASLLLEHPGLRRRRYAWTSPLATTLGLAGQRYGDVLVEVELDPRALVASFRPGAAEPFAFVTMEGRPVTVAAALAEPWRIAAIYHVREGARELIPYREFVLCNEAMVARWSLATPELARRVEEERALVESLGTGPFGHVPGAALELPATSTWATAPGRPSLIERWHAALAFDSPRYRATPANLAAIAAALRGYLVEGPPLVHRPEVAFPPG